MLAHYVLHVHMYEVRVEVNPGLFSHSNSHQKSPTLHLTPCNFNWKTRISQPIFHKYVHCKKEYTINIIAN